MRSVFEIAGTIAERSDWKLSNLSLQKLAYLGQMLHLGETGRPLFKEDFEAWDYGPVIPGLYHDLKMFGAKPVAPYSSLRPQTALSTEENEVVSQMVEIGRTKSPGNLVSITHWKDGAWARVYARHVQGLKIPKELIRQEYTARMQAVVA